MVHKGKKSLFWLNLPKDARIDFHWKLACSLWAKWGSCKQKCSPHKRFSKKCYVNKHHQSNVHDPGAWYSLSTFPTAAAAHRRRVPGGRPVFSQTWSTKHSCCAADGCDTHSRAAVVRYVWKCWVKWSSRSVFTAGLLRVYVTHCVCTQSPQKVVIAQTVPKLLGHGNNLSFWRLELQGKFFREWCRKELLRMWRFSISRFLHDHSCGGDSIEACAVIT